MFRTLTDDLPEKNDEEELEDMMVKIESKPERLSKNYRYFYRGAYIKSKPEEIKSTYTKKLTLQDYERYFKQFEYKEALLEAIKTNHPEVVLAVLEELVERNVLCLALSHLEIKQLQEILGFINLRISNPKYSAMLIEVSSLLLDMYSCGISLSNDVQKSLELVKKAVEKEYLLETNLISLKGMIEIVKTSTMT